MIEKNRTVEILEMIVYFVTLLYSFYCFISNTAVSTVFVACMGIAVAFLCILEKIWKSRSRLILAVLSAILFALTGFNLSALPTLLLIVILKNDDVRKLAIIDAAVRFCMITYCIMSKNQADISFYYLGFALEMLYVLDGVYELSAFVIAAVAGIVLRYYSILPLLVFYELLWQIGNRSGLLDNIGFMMTSEQLFPVVYLLAWLIRGKHSALFECLSHYGIVAGILGIAIVAFVIRWDFAWMHRKGMKKLAVVLFTVILGGIFSEVLLSVCGCLLVAVFGISFSYDHDYASELAEYDRNNEVVSIEKQKLMQLDMLKDIKKVCEENGITYFLGGGTMLGAIRHKGYIPWDDDVDIMLPRKDYERFAEIYNSQCDPNFKYLDFRHTYGYYYAFGKVIDRRTKMFEFKYKNVDEMGIYIDVFPIEVLPDDEGSIKKMFRNYALLRKPIFLYQRNDVNKLKRRNRIVERIRVFISYLIGYFNVYYFTLLLMDKAIRKYEHSETNHVACLTGLYKEKELMPTSYMRENVMVRFEDEEYAVPIDYHDYLTKHYGDYMQLPPEENRIPRHENRSFWR